MKKFLKLAAITFFFSVPLPVMSHLAHAQTICGKRADMIKALLETSKEKVTSLGIVNGTNVVELYQSAGGKTWSIMVTQPNGRMCFIASGSDWTDGKPDKLGTPS